MSGAGETVVLLLRRFTLRHWRQAPVQSALLVLILALGIAVFFAMRIANRAVLAGFEDFGALVEQESDWVITSPAGSLPEESLREMRQALGARPVSLMPVLELTAAEPSRGEAEQKFGAQRAYTLLGTDLVALANLTLPSERDASMLRSGVFISARLAEREGLAVGSKLPLVLHDRVEEFEIAGVLPRAPETVLLIDLPILQKLGRMEGRIERVECLVEPGAGAARLRAEVREVLQQDRWIVSSPNERRETSARMTAALRLNLTLLSSLALLVGFYFIYEALDGAVVRRREEIATLRSLGFMEETIRLAWLAEAALLGLAGGTLGGVLGWIGAQGTVRLVSRSVNALYQASHVEHAPFHVGDVGWPMLLGVSFSVMAGWLPAREAARTPPAQALRRHALVALAGLRWWPGALLLGIALAAAWLPPVRLTGQTTIPAGGYVATLASVLGVSALAGRMLAFAGRWSAQSAPFRVALSQLRRPSLRHVIATSCLLAAVAMTGGMAVLVGSYDLTMRAWLARSFLSDLYISSEGAQSASSTNRIPPETWRAIAKDPEVEDSYAVQMTPVALPEGPTLLAGGDLGFIGRHVDMSWLERPEPAVYDASQNRALVLASEAFLQRFHRRLGDEVAVPTPAGVQRLRIAGVFADYGNERGTLLVERQRFAEWWGHELAATITLKLRPGVDPVAHRARIRAAHPELNVFTNRALREQALRVFQETFAITYALEIIGVTVAVAGLGLTLASIFLQRRGDLATLRALAWTQGEIARAAAVEGVLLAVVGLLAGLGLSLVLGALLVFVINRQSFGWTLQYHIPWGSMALLSALVLASAATVSLLVGRWAARLPGDREE